jgi:mono/diheme cytochrome c family protein
MSKYLKLIGMVIGVIAAIGLVVFIVIQFVPVEQTNPPVVSEPKWDSPQTKELVQRACYDCHSNETKWPWYSQVAPVSWLVADHVNEGRSKLNFSEWQVNQGGEGGEGDEAIEAEGEEAGESGGGGEAVEAEGEEGPEPDEIVEEVEKGEMPLPSYLLMHPEARLTDAELAALIAGLKVTFGPGGVSSK